MVFTWLLSTLDLDVILSRLIRQGGTHLHSGSCVLRRGSEVCVPFLDCVCCVFFEALRWILAPRSVSKRCRELRAWIGRSPVPAPFVERPHTTLLNAHLLKRPSLCVCLLPGPLFHSLHLSPLLPTPRYLHQFSFILFHSPDIYLMEAGLEEVIQYSGKQEQNWTSKHWGGGKSAAICHPAYWAEVFTLGY